MNSILLPFQVLAPENGDSEKKFQTLTDACFGSRGAPKLDCLPIVIANLFNALLFLAGAAALITIILGGFRLITAQGNPQEIQKAKHTLTYAIIGLVIIFLSWGIVGFITLAVGVEMFTPSLRFTP